MRRFFSGIIILFSLITVGCESKEEKEQAQAQELQTVAENYYEEGNLDKTIETYEEILQLDIEKASIREKIDSIEDEINNAQATRKFLDELYEIEKNRLRSGISVSASDMEYIINDIKTIVDDFESLDTSDDTEINKFVKSIKQDDSYKGYQTLKDELNSEIYDDGGTTDAISILDSSFNAFSTSVMAYKREYILGCIENVLSNQIPSKYDSVIQ